MNLKNSKLSQLFVRVAVSTAFLSAVADRLGFWGPPGSPNVSWGDWEHFLKYSNKLNFYASPGIGEMLAIAATSLEVILGFLLLVGYKTRTSALLSGILLVLFGISMTMALGIKTTFNYSVWIGAGACFLLAASETYFFSLDNHLNNK